MKKIAIILLVCVFSLNINANIKQEEIPIDKEVRYGVLENGLTYYIRHNEEPKERASFYLVQNVGAILETDEQNGLAHFLEHMAFNGLGHFKGKAMLEYLEKNGVSFGREINAYTSTDETVYNISSVPTQNPNLIDSTLWVLYDWCDNLLLEDTEIDAERGVIVEEWRTRRDARFRMRQKELSLLYHDSKYSRRDVIGDLDVIKNFDYQTIKDFYHDWYRTDLQAVVVVGDIDVDKIENIIKERFSKIERVENAKERKNFEIPDNDEPRYALITDKEATFNTVKLTFKHNPDNAKLLGDVYLKNMYIKSLFTSMIGNRLNEPLHTDSPPYMGAMAYVYSSFRPKEDYVLYLMHPEGAALKALEASVFIMEQAKKHGFTQSELERAKTSLLNNFEDALKKKGEIDNESYAKEYKYHFLTGEPIPGIEYEYNYLKNVLPEITINDINKIAERFLVDYNFLIAVSGPEKEGLTHPGKTEILDLINTIKESDIEPYQDTEVAQSLMNEKPHKGSIVKRNTIDDLGAEELVLSNGIKVFIKQSDLEKESVLFEAHSWGGYSLLPDDQIANAMFFGDFIGSYGVGDFSNLDLQKILNGKNVSVSSRLSKLSETVSGSATTKDLEALFQLVYLKFTAPRFDEKMYHSVYSRLESYIESRGADINNAFRDSVTLLMANYHPRVHTLKKELLNQVSFEEINQIYQQRFGNPGDFTFTVSGDFNMDTISQFIETYIASLPVSDSKEYYVDNHVRAPENDVVNHFKLPMATEKATVYINLHKEYKYDIKDEIQLYIISRLLSKRYLEEIREKEGGSYGVSVSSSFKNHPFDGLNLRLAFDCDPEKMDKLKAIALNEIDKIIEGDVVDADLEEIKQSIIKSGNERINNLSYWHERLSDYAIEGEMPMLRDEIEVFVNDLDTKKIVKTAKRLLKKTKKVEIVMSSL